MLTMRTRPSARARQQRERERERGQKDANGVGVVEGSVTREPARARGLVGHGHNRLLRPGPVVSLLDPVQDLGVLVGDVEGAEVPPRSLPENEAVADDGGFPHCRRHRALRL